MKGLKSPFSISYTIHKSMVKFKLSPKSEYDRETDRQTDYC